MLHVSSETPQIPLLGRTLSPDSLRRHSRSPQEKRWRATLYQKKCPSRRQLTTYLLPRVGLEDRAGSGKNHLADGVFVEVFGDMSGSAYRSALDLRCRRLKGIVHHWKNVRLDVRFWGFSHENIYIFKQSDSCLKRYSIEILSTGSSTKKNNGLLRKK